MGKRIEYILYSMGLTPNYKGYQQLILALRIVMEEPDSLRVATKQLYPAVAIRCGTNWKAVERNIRGMIKIAWETAPEKLKELSGCPLEKRPKPTQFLAFFAHYLLRVQ